jgi:uncharacterized protein (UPF0147 family)
MSRITKRETAQWVECLAHDKRVPKDVREMCADIVRRLRGKPMKKGKML